MPAISAATWARGGVAPGAGGYVPPDKRGITFHAEVFTPGLDTIDERLIGHLHTALIQRMGEAAEAILVASKAKLQHKPADIVTPDGNIYGYDTGLMHDTLQAYLTEIALVGVFYDFRSDEADYWQFVEFGHMLRNGQWWPGYHFMGQTIVEMQPMLRGKVQQALSDAIVALAGEASALKSAVQGAALIMGRMS